MECKILGILRDFCIIRVEDLEDTQRDYVSRIVASDHNYLLDFNFCGIALICHVSRPHCCGLRHVELRPPATVERGRERDTIRSGEYGVGFSERAAVLSAGGCVRRG